MIPNEFLPSSQGHGTVLIPDELAERGVESIRAIIPQRNFRLILPMADQTFYHLCRLSFLDEVDERILTFIQKARAIRYAEPMQQAKHEAKKTLAIS